MKIQSDDNRADFAVRLLASIGLPVIVVDTEFRVVYWNKGAEETLGWKAEEMIGIDILSAAGIGISDSRAESLIDQLAGGEAVTEDFQLTRRDGHRFPVLVNLTPLLDDSGDFVGMVAVGTDITERYAMEEANRRLSAIVESSNDAILGFDLGGRITSWNDAATRLFGHSASERVGLLSEVVTSPERWTGPQFLTQLPDGEASSGMSFESDYVHPDGRRFLVESTVHSVRDRLGNVVGGAAVCRDVTERRELEQLAADEHQQLEEAQQIARLGSFEFDYVTGALRWSRELRRLAGLDDDEAPSVERFFDRIHPEDRQLFLDHLGPDAPYDSDFDITYRIVRTDGEERRLHTLGRIVRNESREVVRVVGSTQDITDRLHAEEARRVAEQQFSIAFELGSVGMCILDLDRKVRQVNPTVCRILGRTPNELIGHSPDEFSHPSDVPLRGESPTEALLSSPKNHVEFERRYLRPDGEAIHTIVHLALVRDASGDPMYTLAQIVDITDRKRAEEELEQLAMHDPLTGLPNRNLLQDRLETALNRSHRTQSKVAVVFVDIDHFKLVNDSLGHSAGDDLLRQLAHRLGGCTRAGDTIARFGGDEFVLVCEDVNDVAEATTIGERVGAVCDEPFDIDDQQMYVTVSSGIVVATEGDTPATLMRDADTAMYRAKERGRARSELFDPDLRSRATRRLDIELALRHALERHEFRLEYQPIVGLPGDLPSAVEALIRWDHPERGVVPPAEFVYAAEETGLIVPIGEWVLEQAIAQTAVWRRTLPGAERLLVAVNLSPRQLLSGDLLERALGALSAHGLSPDGLCLEITETAAMDDVDISVPLLRGFADAGIVLAVDDFGAGYSSLSRLKRLPVKLLKIDRSFVDGLGTDLDDSSIVHAIVSLGKALNLMLCAEGVETEEQRAELVELGCQTAQGYLWSKPLRPEEFEVWFSSSVAAPVR
jgi:diguanylate cyclase (GGDEF)-like protein/PAS domain S-box-containing protein